MRVCPKRGCERTLEPGEKLCPSCQSKRKRFLKGVVEVVTTVVGVIVVVLTKGVRGKGI